MNYYRHFGLSRPPFEIVGQPPTLYMSKAHREGLAALQWALLHEPGCFTLLMGDVGTGKTTLINVILARNHDGARIAYVMNPKLSFEEMLRVILKQLGHLPAVWTKLELLEKFEWVLEQLRPQERIAIIIDEAQGLSDNTLEELRLFSNYAQSGKGHLKILLVGQPELLQRLMSPSLRQFHQRIGARAVLNPLQRDEAFEYVEYKLQQSGGSARKIFAKHALAELIAHSQGIPRQLNLLCNNALIRAFAADLPWVTLSVARAAIKEYKNLGGTAEDVHEPPGLRATIVRPAAALAGLGFAALIGLYALGVRLPGFVLRDRTDGISIASASVGKSSRVKENPAAKAETPKETRSSTPPERAAPIDGPPAARTTQPPRPRRRPYKIQVEAAMDRSSADAMVQRLQRLGYSSHLVTISIEDQTWFRVEIGPYATEEEAEAAEDQLQQKYNSVYAGGNGPRPAHADGGNSASESGGETQYSATPRD